MLKELIVIKRRYDVVILVKKLRRISVQILKCRDKQSDY